MESSFILHKINYILLLYSSVNITEYINYVSLFSDIENIFQKSVAPVLKTTRLPPDYVEEYRQDYGYIGPALCAAVAKARTQPTVLAPTAATTTALTTNQQQNSNCTGKTLVQTGTMLQ